METPKSQKKRPWAVLVLSFLAFCGLSYTIWNISPDTVWTIFFLKISPIFLFFPLIFLCCYGIAAFLSRRAQQGLLIALLIVLFLFFRLLNLTNPLFIILLLVLFITLEAVIWKKEI